MHRSDPTCPSQNVNQDFVTDSPRHIGSGDLGGDITRSGLLPRPIALVHWDQPPVGEPGLYQASFGPLNFGSAGQIPVPA